MLSTAAGASSAFQAIATAARLAVPYAGTAIPSGTRVGIASALVDPPEAARHAALSPGAGRVIGTQPAVLLGNRSIDTILIETDGGDTESNRVDSGLVDYAKPLPLLPGVVAEWLSGVQKDSLGAQIDRLRACGVWADRWTSPDLLAQLHECLRRPVDTIICTVLDADPALPVSRVCCEEQGPAIVGAVAALGKLTGASRLWVVVDQEAPASTWAAMRDAAGVGGESLRIVPMENDYPQADPTLLLYTLIRRRLRPGHLPTEQGVLLLDAAAALAVSRALIQNQPMLHVPVAVFEQTHGRTHLISVPVGTRVGDLLTQLHVPRHGLDLRAGGPLREVRVAWDDIIAGTELGIYAVAREPDVNPNPCVRCGWCIEGCPVRIHPAGILQAAQEHDHAMAEQYGLAACIECGICSYVCPSHLPLLQGVRILRGEAMRVAGDDEDEARVETGA